MHAQQLQAQCAAPVCDWEPLYSGGHSTSDILHGDTAPSIWTHHGWRHHSWRHCLPPSEQFMGDNHCPVGIIRVSWVGISEAGSEVLSEHPSPTPQWVKKDRGARGTTVSLVRGPSVPSFSLV